MARPQPAGRRRGRAGDAGRELAVYADLERLRREVAAPEIVREAGPGVGSAYADFFEAKISHPNTRNAHRRAAGEIGTRCRHVIDLT
jgi:hypothetical protein